MATILDYLGRPINQKKLTEEIATPSIFGVRQPFRESVTFGLTPERLAGILTAVDSQGDALEYLSLAEEMEERDPHYHSVLATRKMAVSGLSVRVEAASDDPRDVEIADAVREVVRHEEFSNLISDQLDALGKGFAVSEIEWDKSGAQWYPVGYTFRDPRFFMFDRFTGQELRLRDMADPGYGIPLEAYKFVQHRPRLKTGLPIRGGLARLACVSFMCKSYSLRDWMTFAEVFGMPLRVGKYNEGATVENKSALLRAVSNIGTDAAAIIPESMAIEFIASSATTGGDKLFQGLADWLDRQVSKGVLGQTSSADAQSTGLGSGVAAAHDGVREDIRDDDAKKLAATLRRDVVRPFVDLNYGPQKNYPRICIEEDESDDLELLSKSLPPFINLGLRVEASVIRDKFGLPEPEPDAEILRAPAPSFQQVAPPPQQIVPPPAQAAQSMRLALMQRVVDGVELTADQRTLLGLASRQTEDSIDILADMALDKWEPVMAPVLSPILEMAAKATSLAQLKRDLKKAKLNTDQFAQALATLTFTARGLGDTTDAE